MRTYAEFQPTGMDPKGLGLNGRQHWLVAPCGTNRDADVLTRANWHALQDLLEALPRRKKLGHDVTDWELHRFGHWGCGWFEIIIVRPRSPAQELCQSIADGLANYPVVCDSTLSDLEYREQCETWTRMRPSERRVLTDRAGLKHYAARTIG